MTRSDNWAAAPSATNFLHVIPNLNFIFPTEHQLRENYSEVLLVSFLLSWIQTQHYPSSGPLCGQQSQLMIALAYENRFRISPLIAWTNEESIV